MTIDDIALCFVQGLGTKGIRHLIEIYGTAHSVFEASEADLIARGELRPKIAAEVSSHASFTAAQREMRHMERHGIKALASTDAVFPPLLAECADPPHVIYFQGDESLLSRRGLAVVGTRTMSPYGQRVGDRLIEQLSHCAPDTVIVSGLAAGNDANAHRAALHYGLPTVAVIANSLPEVTPAENRTLADKILLSGGTILTEVSSQTPNKGALYLARNRIIAALTEATLVVESPYEGGSLDTAEHAESYGRTVMVPPARIDDKTSYGTNRLLKLRKAVAVCSGADIAHELGWDIVSVGNVPEKAPEIITLTDDERRLLSALGANEAVDYDTLSERSEIEMGRMCALMMGLELSGLVRILPGKRCEKV